MRVDVPPMGASGMVLLSNADRVPIAQGGRSWYPATVRYTLNRAQ